MSEETCDAKMVGRNGVQLMAPSDLERVEVAQVFDGDTVLLDDGRKVRVVGINTPELGHHDRPIEPLAKKAKERLTQLLFSQVSQTSNKASRNSLGPAMLRIGNDNKDHYGRILGHLFSIDGRNVASAMLLEGLGFHVAIPPNLWAARCYFSAQKVARKAGVGVWGQPYYGAKLASLRNLQGGYQRIQGKIEQLFVTKKHMWVDMVGHVTLKLDRRDSKYQKGQVLEHILNAYENKALKELPMVVVQGWLIDRKRWGGRMAEKIEKGERNRWQLNLRHHYQWHFYKQPFTK